MRLLKAATKKAGGGAGIPDKEERRGWEETIQEGPVGSRKRTGIL